MLSSATFNIRKNAALSGLLSLAIVIVIMVGIESTIEINQVAVGERYWTFG